MEVKYKVLAYIYRYVGKELQVLVFDHPGVPEVNPQVPAGTIQENEDPVKGVLREVFKESGLKFDSVKNHLGLFKYEFVEKNQIHMRHVFEIESSDLPESWSHTVISNDSDNGERFDYYWLSLEEAKRKLVVDQGKYLPTVNGHFITKDNILSEYVNEELKVGGLNANFSKFFSFERIAAHYFSIPSGYRTSEPHAESLEDEFVFIISGEIDLWLNGNIKKMRAGDSIGFKAGTGVGHCFINNSGEDCELFVSGDRTKKDNQYHFHLDPSLKEECGDKWWNDMPKQILGGHDGMPGSETDKFVDESVSIFNGYMNLPEKPCYYPEDKEPLTHGVNLVSDYSFDNISIWLEKLPPGNRSSWPHAHSVEEEFVLILKGSPHIVLDDKEYKVEAMTGVDFKPGSGVSHTIVNHSSEDVFYLCVGEKKRNGDQIFYPHHPKRNEEMKEKGAFWDLK